MREVIEMKLSELKPYDNNPRNNVQAVDIVKKSITEYGFTNPILIDEHNVIIAGHTRYQASRELGLDKVPVIKLTGLNEAQIKAYRVMDNKSGDFAEWDYVKLLKELDSIDGELDLALSGFDLIDIEKMRIEFELEDVPDLNLDDDTEVDVAKPEKEKRIIQYNIIFNSEEEQDIWFDHLRKLKNKYPELETIAERLVADILEGENEEDGE